MDEPSGARLQIQGLGMPCSTLGAAADRLLNKPVFEVVEDIVNINKNKNLKKIKNNNINKNKEKDRELIILTDLDKKGKQLYGKLKKDLCRNGYNIDHYFREFLQKNTKIRQIEGLPRYIERLK